jgi:hypothetical protein
MEEYYLIVDKETGEPVKDENGTPKKFVTRRIAEMFIEENGIDYDYWEIK